MKERLFKFSAIMLWVLLVINLLGFLSFVGNAQEELVCQSVDITIEAGSEIEPLLFVDKAMVTENICEALKISSIEGQNLELLSPARLERVLQRNDYVKKSVVYKDIMGILYLKVEQKRPIARVMTEVLDYYITESGGKMNVSNDFTCKVPIVSGCMYEGMQNKDSMTSKAGKDVFAIASAVDTSIFWKAQVEQIVVDSSGDIVFYMNLGKQKVIVGEAADLYEKLNKLKVFYAKVLNTRGWNTFNVLNLKFKNQVVCTY
ncbi:MAG: hypothetical protein EXR21_03095 [Flavobacteriaceae bacterium]|nr:hypothetical protein [Flavobacteriaceae bacterium]